MDEFACDSVSVCTLVFVANVAGQWRCCVSLHGADQERCKYAVLMSVMTGCRKVIECTNQSDNDSVIM